MTMPKFDPVAHMQVSVEVGVGTYFPRLHKPEKYNADWWRFDPLYTADQLTEAYEAGKQDQAAELEAARAEIERLENQVQARDAELWGRTQKILQLEQQLAECRKLLLLAKQEFHKLACLGNGDKFGNSVGNVMAQEAIAKINGPVEGLILCDAVPVADANLSGLASDCGVVPKFNYGASLRKLLTGAPVPLYAQWGPK